MRLIAQLNMQYGKQLFGNDCLCLIMTYRISLTGINFSWDCKCRCEHWNVPAKHINRRVPLPEQRLFLNGTLRIRGSSQRQRQQQRLLPLLSTAQAMLSVKAPGHKSALEPRNHCLCSFCSLEESSWWSSSFNEQQGVHSSALGAQSVWRKDQELNLASQQPGKRSGFRKVTCGPV